MVRRAGVPGRVGGQCRSRASARCRTRKQALHQVQRITREKKDMKPKC